MNKTVGSKSLRLLALAPLIFLLAADAAAQSSFKVVMRGLDNPRGLAFATIGNEVALYVAESGRGGSGPCTTVRGVEQCAGATGAVSRWFRGKQKRVVTGLPSYAPANGGGATGPHDISFTEDGRAYVAVGLHGPLTLRNTFGNGFGWLVRLHPNGTFSNEVDISAYEGEVNPGGGPVDSNPHGLLAGWGGRFVVEAGGNALLRLGDDGDISTLAIFPSRAQGRSTDSVTSAVAVGRDAAFYVSEITGVPFAAGAARIYRVVPGHAPEVFAEGFTAVIDIDFDRRGNLYVLELASGTGLAGPGTLTRVTRNGRRSVVATGLNRPTSVAIAPRGCHAYVSHNGTLAGTGEVVRIPLRGCAGG